MKSKSKKAPSRKGVLFMEGLPADLKMKFKSVCAGKGHSMRDAIIDLMRDYIQR